MPKLGGKLGSCWVANAPSASYPTLAETTHATTVVVGAGIVGLTVALALCEEARSVVVLEGLAVGEQVTGRSTAKITTQHALVYRHLVETFGFDRARLYADANRAGVRRIEDWIAGHGIACDLERKSAYAYADMPVRTFDIEAEAEAARSLGFEAHVFPRAPLPFKTAAALHFPDQAQFNPALYLKGLAAAVTRHGGRIFEKSRARSIEEGRRWRVLTDGGMIEAEHVVIATNMTVKSPVGMANRTQPRSHAAMAFRLADPTAIDGMFIGIDDPTHSLRTGRDADGALVVALGPKFNTGHEGDVARRFHELEAWVRERLPVGELAWRWCNEDYDTADRVAYAGTPDPKKAPGFHIATGFNAWGISNGTAAGLLIADLIAGRANPWQALYDPTRPYPEDFHKNGDSQSYISSVDDIPPGAGGVIVKGKDKIAVWKEEAGQCHAVSATCTHKGGTVTWNNADQTWDCPCHGSIFTKDGAVIHGPARNPLTAVDL